VTSNFVVSGGLLVVVRRMCKMFRNFSVIFRGRLRHETPSAAERIGRRSRYYPTLRLSRCSAASSRPCSVFIQKASETPAGAANIANRNAVNHRGERSERRQPQDYCCCFLNNESGGQAPRLASDPAPKYGALSVTKGQVRVEWSHVADEQLALRWSELGGPPVDAFGCPQDPTAENNASAPASPRNSHAAALKIPSHIG
jgi:hypothetical protein